MAKVNSMLKSINTYSAALDKLLGKFDSATGSMMAVIDRLDISAGKILEAGEAANNAASMMQSFGDAASNIVSDMKETGKSLDGTSQKMKEAGHAADIATGQMLDIGDTLEQITGSFANTGKGIGSASKNLSEAGNNIGNMNKSLDKTESSSSKAGSKVKGLINMFKGLGNITKAFDLSDSVAMSNKKLSIVNDGKQTDEALQGNVAAAAINSRSSYKDMAGYVSKLSGAGGTFKDNDQTVAFTELMQKAIVAGGTGDSAEAMSQMVDSLSKGSLGSDDLKAASGASPLIMKSLESYTGKSSEDLYKMADKGKITADNIKNAMFSMSGDINKQFDGTKMTFGETWDKLKEGAMQAASGVLEKLNEIISNPQVQLFIDKLIAGMSLLGDAIGQVCDFIIGNWNIIGPILAFLVGVVLAVMIADTIAMAAAWLAVNLPILLIIGALAAVIAILLNVGVSFAQICGAVGGFIGVLAAYIYNRFVYMWNIAAAFINFLGNAFHDLPASAKILFLDMAVNALKYITNITKGFSSLINKLTGKKINLTAGITKMTDALSAEKEQTKKESGYKVFVKDKTFLDYNKAAGKGKDIGTKTAEYLSKASAKGKNMLKDPASTAKYGYQPYVEGKDKPDNSTAPLKVEGTGAGGSMNVNMPDEDKEYLKNIAERDYIANVATNSLAPNISVQFGDVHQTADANKVAGRIKKILREQIAMASEGVY